MQGKSQSNNVAASARVGLVRAATFLAALGAIISASPAEASINRFESKTIAIKPYAEAAGYGFDLKNPITGKQLNWRPNTRSLSRLDVYLYGLIGFGYGTRGALSNEDLARKGETDYEDWRFSFAFPALHLALNYQKFTGFYAENIPVGSTEPFVQARGMSAENASANLTWIVNPQRFSLQAALDQTVRQESSGGSWLVGVAASAVRFQNGEPLIPATLRSEFGVDQNTKNAEFASTLVKGGYGYTLVYARSYFLTGVLMIGLGPQIATYSDGTTEKQIQRQASKVDLALSTGFNGETFFFGTTTVLDSTAYKTESIEIPSTLSSFRLFVGMRL